LANAGQCEVSKPTMPIRSSLMTMRLPFTSYADFGVSSYLHAAEIPLGSAKGVGTRSLPIARLRRGRTSHTKTRQGTRATQTGLADRPGRPTRQTDQADRLKLKHGVSARTMKLEAVQHELKEWGEIIITTDAGDLYELHLGDTEFDT